MADEPNTANYPYRHVHLTAGGVSLVPTEASLMATVDAIRKIRIRWEHEVMETGSGDYPGGLKALLGSDNFDYAAALLPDGSFRFVKRPDGSWFDRMGLDDVAQRQTIPSRTHGADDMPRSQP